MSDIDELTKEVLTKHGIKIGRDDPIWVLYTLNE
jgi:hypothetical protein